MTPAAEAGIVDDVSWSALATELNGTRVWDCSYFQDALSEACEAAMKLIGSPPKVISPSAGGGDGGGGPNTGTWTRSDDEGAACGWWDTLEETHCTVSLQDRPVKYLALYYCNSSCDKWSKTSGSLHNYGMENGQVSADTWHWAVAFKNGERISCAGNVDTKGGNRAEAILGSNSADGCANAWGSWGAGVIYN